MTFIFLCSTCRCSTFLIFDILISNVNISIFSSLLLYLISHIAYSPEQINGTKHTSSLPPSVNSSPATNIQDTSSTTKRNILTQRPSFHVTTWKISTSDVARSQINTTSLTPIFKSSTSLL